VYAVLTWPMVRPDGIVIFDDYEWKMLPDEIDRPKLGIDGFLAVHAGQYRALHRGYQLIIEKVAVPRSNDVIWRLQVCSLPEPGSFRRRRESCAPSGSTRVAIVLILRWHKCSKRLLEPFVAYQGPFR
jgi:hypothetical protein